MVFENIGCMVLEKKIGKVSERKVGIPKNKGVVFLGFRYTKISRKMWGIQLCCWF